MTDALFDRSSADVTNQRVNHHTEVEWKGRPQETIREGIVLVLAFEENCDRLRLIDELGLVVERIQGVWGAYWPVRSADGALFASVRELPRAIREFVPSAGKLVTYSWEGMPRFIPIDDRITLPVFCGSEVERDRLIARLGVTIAKKTRGTFSAWWPPREREDLSALRFDGDGGYTPRPRYPIYIPSKGRYDPKSALTVKALQADQVPFFVAVEPQEADAYRRLIGSGGGTVLVLPFSNLGKGSIPARNFCRDHAEASGAMRHWQLDDNIIEFRRLWYGRRIPCDVSVALRVCEDFTDQYENVGVSGLNYQMFVPSETPTPYYTNVHVYSCTLVNHAMPFRWRMTYNEDTDLCLQSLVGGWATIALNAFMCNKMRTMAMKGGNTDQLYKEDGRLVMAHTLARAWPGLVEVRHRFGRPQHVVDWGKFRGLELRESPTPVRRLGEYGLRLRAVRDEVKSPALRRLLDEFPSNGCVI